MMQQHTLSCLLLLLLPSLFLGINQATSSIDDDAGFIYSGFSGASLTLDGMATITSSGLLQLSSGTGERKGHAFHPELLSFRNAPGGKVQSFSVSFVFAILSIAPNLSSHGMAFLVSPSKNLSSSGTRGFLGLFNRQNSGNASNHIFAVELDTIQNTEFLDISDNHVGVDVNGIRSVRSSYTGYYDSQGNFQNMTLNSHELRQVWIDYDEVATEISVTIAPLKMNKPMRPLILTTYNLSAVLADQAYVGFSSTTGSIDSQHYVLGWSFAMNNQSAPGIDVDKLPKLPHEGSKNSSNKVVEIAVPIATAIFILVVGVVILQFTWRQLKYAELREDWEVEFGPHRLSYKDLFSATQGFKDKNLLGIGGFGSVYRGVLPMSKLEVAVKKVSHESRQGIKEFIAEVVSIGRMRHRNLVPLLGYCRRRGELLLVYEYMSNGSLDKYLYAQGSSKPPLNWVQRFHIIKGIASGLLYLHEEWEKVVIHRDIKASNVLLDSEMNARLGDFGLAKLYDHGIDAQTTHVVGTMGYIAPELARTGKASPVTDVFAFGVFLLEVTCGQRPVEHNRENNRVSMLVDWVLEKWHKGLLAKAVDPRIHDEFDINQTILVLKLGLLCSHPIPDARPTMRQVMQYLDGDMMLPEKMPESLTLGMQLLMQSEGFDSYIMSQATTSVSCGTLTDISGGR